MALAESLYMSGIISYPRTESTAYPEDGADLAAAIAQHSSHAVWGGHAAALVAGYSGKQLALPPRGGVDKGDHPPITPTRCVPRQALQRNDEWKLYELVARTWLASLSPPLIYLEHTARLSIGAEAFTYTWHSLGDAGKDAVGGGVSRSGGGEGSRMVWRQGYYRNGVWQRGRYEEA
jgi:DNA topoisomerase-3